MGAVAAYGLGSSVVSVSFGDTSNGDSSADQNPTAIPAGDTRWYYQTVTFPTVWTPSWGFVW